MNLEPKVGDLYPVWWETNDSRPAGQHMARIIEILPYKGPFDFIKCVYKLEAPETRRGYLLMSIEVVKPGPLPSDKTS